MRFAILTALLAVLPAQAEPPFYPDKQKLLAWRDEQGKEHPVRSPADWEKRRAHILANMQLVMGELPREARKPPVVKVTEEVKAEKFVRRKITFEVGKGERVPAYLFLPTGGTGKRPAVLCLHQTVSIGKGEPAG